MKKPPHCEPTQTFTRSHRLSVNNLTTLGLVIIIGLMIHNDKMDAKAADATPSAQTVATTTPPAPAKMGSQVFLWDSLKFVPSATGARVTVFEAPTPTLDKFHCHISTLNPGENTGPLHRHPQEEFIVIK